MESDRSAISEASSDNGSLLYNISSGRNGRGRRSRGGANRGSGRGKGKGRGRGARRGAIGRAGQGARARGGNGRGTRGGAGGVRGGVQNRANRARTTLERKKEQIREIIGQLSEDQIRELLALTVERQPSVLFDLVEKVNQSLQPDNDHPEDPAPPPGQPNQPDWCVCTYCREMPTEEEKLCCNNQPDFCYTRMADFDVLILDQAVLGLARAYRNDVLALPQDDNFNKSNRHAGYRQFTLWRHGRLGAGDRRVIPSCCVWRIRDMYPDPSGQYTGYIPGRLG